MEKKGPRFQFPRMHCFVYINELIFSWRAKIIKNADPQRGQAMFVCALEPVKTFPDPVSSASTWPNQLAGFLRRALPAGPAPGKPRPAPPASAPGLGPAPRTPGGLPCLTTRWVKARLALALSCGTLGNRLSPCEPSFLLGEMGVDMNTSRCLTSQGPAGRAPAQSPCTPTTWLQH